MKSNENNNSQMNPGCCCYDGVSRWRQLLWYTLHGYIFWCLFLALAPMIWFYPLNELSITGYEALSLLTLTPIITESAFILKLLQKPHMIIILRLLSVVSLASFQAPDTLLRLLFLSLGTSCALLVFAITLWNPNYKIRFLTLWGLLLGFLLFLVSRIWFLSFVPAWWTQTTNTIIISIALGVNIDHIISDLTVEINSAKASLNTNSNYKLDEQNNLPHDGETNNSIRNVSTENNTLTDVPNKTTKIQSCEEETQENSEVSTPVTNGLTSNSNNVHISQASFSSSFLLIGIGFGSLIFLTGWTFGEVSLICRWVVEGYPLHGPLPQFWGCPVLLLLGVGVCLSRQHFTKHFAWWLLGVLSLFLLYYLKTWVAYASGLFLAVFTLSIWPHMVSRAIQCPPGRTIFVCMLTWIIESLFFVWTVAYNFVPGGVYTREHTDYLISFIAVTLLSGYFTGAGAKYPSDAFIHMDSKMWNEIKKAILLLLCIGLLGFGTRSNHFEQPKPSKIFTAAIWTFHFGYDNYGWPSMERAEKVLRETHADFITLLESDASKPFLGNNDLGMWFGQKLGMYVDFGPATKKHTWGNLILSKYPIVKSVHHLLPSPQGELAPAVSATVNISGTLVDFVVTHMGNHRDNEDRKQQAIYLSSILKSSPNPAVFLGYVTSYPYGRDYTQFIEEGQMNDIDPTDHDRWCQYIMYKKLIRLAYARISRGELSDTEIQMAKFKIPKNPSSYKDNYKVLHRHEDVPEYQRFSRKFGHYYPTAAPSSQGEQLYQMATPKYFV
ncbi:PGAP2-interacting protein isoform X1 [Octopus bimaculoides]|uniref:PGAP2-interacting protein n=1 Tax=Octopus bimaculoides TaxID=37653 RepID=A0A0L8HLK6_OCTBM|nr:PGAP2-interacting protein isoform X1 [Octopus bimaculoides]|eukprot:XP_014771651.1 PREDICTED: PGAP2-interacting protein-like [Octopus bimaculoides]